MELRLHKNVTPDMLIKAGFKPSYSLKNIFRFRERLYKDNTHTKGSYKNG